MAAPARVWKKLRIEPYDPDAVDGDGDGIVQEGTAWERPAGTRILDVASGVEVTRGSRTGSARVGQYRVVRKSSSTGKFEDVDYVRSYDGEASSGAVSPLGDVGASSLGEMGLPSVRAVTRPTVAVEVDVPDSDAPDADAPDADVPDVDDPGARVRARNAEISRRLDEAGAGKQFAESPDPSVMEYGTSGDRQRWRESGREGRAELERKSIAGDLKIVQENLANGVIPPREQFTNNPSVEEMLEEYPELKQLIIDTPAEELASMISEGLLEYLNGMGSLRIRVSEKDASVLSVIADGRYGNREEDVSRYGRSGTLSSNRKLFETTWGVPYEIEPELRPVYGYAIHPDLMEKRRKLLSKRAGRELTLEECFFSGFTKSKSGDGGGAENYGEVTITLRPEVAERAAASLGDSLVHSREVAPISTQSVDNATLAMGPVGDFEGRILQSLRVLQAMQSGDWSSVNSDHRGSLELDDSAEAQSKLLSPSEYIEAQIPGGIEVDDIQAIHIPIAPLLSNRYDSLAALTRDLLSTDSEFLSEVESLLTVEGMVAIGIDRGVAEYILRIHPPFMKDGEPIDRNTPNYINHLLDNASKAQMSTYIRLRAAEKIKQTAAEKGIEIKWTRVFVDEQGTATPGTATDGRNMDLFDHVGHRAESPEALREQRLEKIRRDAKSWAESESERRGDVFPESEPTPEPVLETPDGDIVDSTSIEAGIRRERFGATTYSYGEEEWETFEEDSDPRGWAEAAYGEWSGMEGNFRMRHASAALMGLPSPDAWGDERGAPEVNEILATGEWEGKPEWAKEQAREIIRMTASMMDAVVESEPTDRVLYRGLSSVPADAPLVNAQPGDVATLPLSAFSPKRRTAESFARGVPGEPGESVMVVLEPGAQAYPAPEGYEDYIPDPDFVGEWIEVPVEYVTHGDFEVVSNGVVDGVRTVRLRQRSTVASNGSGLDVGGADVRAEAVRARNAEVRKQLVDAGIDPDLQVRSDEDAASRSAELAESKAKFMSELQDELRNLDPDEVPSTLPPSQIPSVAELVARHPELRELILSKSPEELASMVDEGILEFTSGLTSVRSKIQTRKGMSGLFGIVSDGRIGNSHESFENRMGSGTFGGERIVYERDRMGIPADVEPTLRPTYGYVLHPDYLEKMRQIKSRIMGREVTEDEILFTAGDDGGGAGSYGNITAILEPEVVERSTVCNGDSLNGNKTVTPITGNTRDSAADAMGGDNLRAIRILHAQLTGNWASVQLETGRFLTVDEAVESLLDTTEFKAENFTKFLQIFDPYYVEAQIPGGVESVDIQEIAIPLGSDLGAETEHLAKSAEYALDVNLTQDIAKQVGELNEPEFHAAVESLLTVEGLGELGVDRETAEYLLETYPPFVDHDSGAPLDRNQWGYGRKLAENVRKLGLSPRLNLMVAEYLKKKGEASGVKVRFIRQGGWQWRTDPGKNVELFDAEGHGKASAEELAEWRRGIVVDEVREAADKARASGAEPPKLVGTPADRVRVRNADVQNSMAQAGITFAVRDPEKFSENAPSSGKVATEAKAQAVRRDLLDAFEGIRNALARSEDEGTSLERELNAAIDAIEEDLVLEPDEINIPSGASMDARGLATRLTPEVRELIRDLQPEELLELIEEETQNILSEMTDIRVRVRDEKLLSVLEDGRVKSAVEVGGEGSASGGKISLRVRPAYESTIGIPEDAPAELRPVSGYAVHPDADEKMRKRIAESTGRPPSEVAIISDDGQDGGDAWSYGNVVVKLRPEVSERSAVGRGDTLNNSLDVAPLGTDDPDKALAAMFGEGNTHAASIALGILQKRLTGDMSGVSSNHYFEVLIPGGVEVDDIEEIAAPMNFMHTSRLVDSDEGFAAEVAFFHSVEGLVSLGFSKEDAEAFVRTLPRPRYGSKQAETYMKYRAAEIMRDRARIKGIRLNLLNVPEGQLTELYEEMIGNIQKEIDRLNEARR